MKTRAWGNYSVSQSATPGRAVNVTAPDSTLLEGVIGMEAEIQRPGQYREAHVYVYGKTRVTRRLTFASFAEAVAFCDRFVSQLEGETQ